MGMSIKSFLKLVELQTKVASIIPFLFGTFYALYRFDTFNAKNFLLMLISLLCIDMATTAINNYMDYKKAVKRHGFGYEQYNAIARDKLKDSTVLTVIAVLLFLAIAFGLILFLNTDYVVLLIGAVSFAVGILYSFGPVPISRTPFGEIFSGGFMGFVIPLLAVYIHVYNRELLSLDFQQGVLDIRMNIPEILLIFLISLPAVVGIANIMLANNICDMQDDFENRRYTLPLYIGRDKSLKVYQILYYIGYAAMLILLLLKILPLVCLISFVTVIPVQKNIKRFYEKQSKAETFVLAVKNFVLINSVYALTIALAVVIKYTL
jgi:1,4-dihydroxy-2-naphthoate polyprenyltransferase